MEYLRPNVYRNVARQLNITVASESVVSDAFLAVAADIFSTGRCLSNLLMNDQDVHAGLLLGTGFRAQSSGLTVTCTNLQPELKEEVCSSLSCHY